MGLGVLPLYGFSIVGSFSFLAGIVGDPAFGDGSVDAFCNGKTVAAGEETIVSTPFKSQGSWTLAHLTRTGRIVHLGIV